MSFVEKLARSKELSAKSSEQSPKSKTLLLNILCFMIQCYEED